tara:strand:+ start:122 stop:1144 length:1023 start_codon:yes stop_codon:yes gene_type:complete
MAKIQQLLKDKNERINYKEVREKYPWITKPKQKCILSPDSDGLLCGLFMSHYLDWEVVGFYDGKVCVLKDGVSAFDEDVCFLDIEIYREGVKSMGHHMLSVYNSELPFDWRKKFKDCIQPNLMRGYDRNSFRLKYPLATIHLLIGILEDIINIKVEESTIFPLLFTDGTFNVMFSYPENVMNWWKYLNVEDNSKLLKNIFMGEDYTTYKLMLEMDNFFRERDSISIPRERGDRLKISNKDSSSYNLEKNGFNYKINNDAKNRCVMFLKLLEKHTNWIYRSESWCFEDMNLMQFTKSDFVSRNWTIKKDNWKSLMDINPLSWAMTSGNNIEFTIESPDKLL